MAKFTSKDIARIAATLKRAKERQHPAHFLIGAGCSISAGIPGAKDLVKKIHTQFEAECDSLSAHERESYGACMALLTINERRDLIRPYLQKAKINWGTIALAQLIGAGFADRILTLNFDLVLENACGLIGLQPAVYDFGVAPASDPAMIVSPAIVHLHGQSYGLVLLNTDEETQAHRKKLQPVLIDTLRSAPLIVIGYSGSADGISQTLLEEFEGREPLYWAGYSDEPEGHLLKLLKKKYFSYFGGSDFDRFMIELAQSLGCWPPDLFFDPAGYLLKCINPVAPYPVAGSGTSVDFLVELRGKLETWRIQTKESDAAGPVSELYMKGEFKAAVELLASRRKSGMISDEDQEAAYWSLIDWAALLEQRAWMADGNQRAGLLSEAGNKYEEALSIKKNGHEALNNWGLLLFRQGERTSNEDAIPLYIAAGQKFEEALRIKPDKHEALTNWGTSLCQRARLSSGDLASQLFAKAAENFAAALSIEPASPAPMINWGASLVVQAKRAEGEEAARLLSAATEKLEAAAKLDGSKTYNLGCLAALRGDEEQCRWALENAEQHGTLPDIAHLNSDPDLGSMREKHWFRELIDRQQKKANF